MSDDYISREAAIARIKRIVEVNRLRTDRVWFTPSGVEYLINEIPAADVRPVVRGKWRKIGKNSFIFVCSACDKTFPYKTSFCPNCGAWMEES